MAWRVAKTKKENNFGLCTEIYIAKVAPGNTVSNNP